MGVEIRRNRQKQYQLKSSISDEILHDPEFVSIDEAKRVLIERAFFKFIEQAIEIDMTFPIGYQVNDKLLRDEEVINNYRKWKSDSFKGDWCQNTYDKYQEIEKRLNIEF